MAAECNRVSHINKLFHSRNAVRSDHCYFPLFEHTYGIDM